ncbi:hypothetical protein L2D14_10620 [Thalassospiraceae bacterium LMO-JJ14]|nr:hypothetical protein L2D14_10620 [Thalassospiraceae bacterium LMO-JJ14]
MIRLLAAGLIALTISSFWPTDAQAKSKCVRIFRQGNIETLINTCNTCVHATIIRSRPGNSVPVGREFNVQARSDFPVPFRGPGRSRITAERPCPGEKGAQKDLLESFNQPEATPKCVSMERGNQGPVLVNKCGLCKAVAIERVTADGASRSRDYMALAGGSTIPVRANGFAGVGLLAEIDCPK